MTSDLEYGYPLDKPPLTVPWGLSRRELVRALSTHGLVASDKDNFVLSCTSLSGLSHQLQFRFDAVYGPKRYMLALVRPQESDVSQSFDTFQRHLEMTFGPPSSSEENDDGWPFHTWNIGDFIVHHSVIVRFMPSENVLIIPPECPPPLLRHCWRTLAYWFTMERFLLSRLMLLWLVPILLAVILLSR